MPVQFGDHIDMNGLQIRELAAGVDPSDAVRVDQLETVAPQGFAQDVGDGILFTHTVTHNLGTLDVLVQTYRKSDGVSVNVTVDRVDADTVAVTFGLLAGLNSHRVVVIPVP
jgi:hypothetical protein